MTKQTKVTTPIKENIGKKKKKVKNTGETALKTNGINKKLKKKKKKCLATGKGVS